MTLAFALQELLAITIGSVTGSMVGFFTHHLIERRKENLRAKAMSEAVHRYIDRHRQSILETAKRLDVRVTK